MLLPDPWSTVRHPGSDITAILSSLVDETRSRIHGSLTKVKMSTSYLPLYVDEEQSVPVIVAEPSYNHLACVGLFGEMD